MKLFVTQEISQDYFFAGFHSVSGDDQHAGKGRFSFHNLNEKSQQRVKERELNDANQLLER